MTPTSDNHLTQQWPCYISKLKMERYGRGGAASGIDSLWNRPGAGLIYPTICFTPGGQESLSLRPRYYCAVPFHQDVVPFQASDLLNAVNTRQFRSFPGGRWPIGAVVRLLASKQMLVIVYILSQRF